MSTAVCRPARRWAYRLGKLPWQCGMRWWLTFATGCIGSGWMRRRRRGRLEEKRLSSSWAPLHCSCGGFELLQEERQGEEWQENMSVAKLVNDKSSKTHPPLIPFFPIFVHRKHKRNLLIRLCRKRRLQGGSGSSAAQENVELPDMFGFTMFFK